MKIWIDADACPRPIKDIVIRAAIRVGVEAILVANHSMEVKAHNLVKFIKVEQGADVADTYIVNSICSDDLVITADVPLADRVVDSGALAINPRGDIYSRESIKQALSIRNFMSLVRDSGVETSGPRPFSDKDKRAFAASFDKVLSRLLRG